MILVDTSIWVDHIRRGDEILADFLQQGLVLAHPHVIGELALGHMRQRDAIIASMIDLPAVKLASDDEVLFLIEQETLFGMGIGYIDAHLLAATRLTPEASLWTRDRRLRAAAEKLSISARISH